MRSYFGTCLFVLIGLLIDLYIFQAIKTIVANTESKTQIAVYSIYWTVSFSVALLGLILPFLPNLVAINAVTKAYLQAILIGILLAKIFACLFFITDDVRRFLAWLSAKFLNQISNNEAKNSPNISRSMFLSWLGLSAGSLLFGTLLAGFRNKYKYQVKNVPLRFSNLPPAFKGLRIVQISDIHSGSLLHRNGVLRGVEMINELKPDLILFTGDLVNNKAEEMASLKDIFSQLKAKMGIYSTLGNHDYGDYVQWTSPEDKQANLAAVKSIHAQLGWKLLLDEHVIIEKESAQIALIGVQNISGKGRFHTYGNLSKAYAGVEHIPFKLLMSHDPSHWDTEVVKDYGTIDLTLSGHTHGMQFGVEIPGLKWSPIQYIYKHWAGLYANQQQFLYVNRGFGFIGYPGRVGIFPEITLIELT